MSNEQKINSYAIVSLVFGVIGILLAGIWIIGLFAVVAGEKFRRLNKAAGGTLKGKVLALIGTILGIIPFLLFIISAITKNLSAPL